MPEFCEKCEMSEVCCVCLVLCVSGLCSVLQCRCIYVPVVLAFGSECDTRAGLYADQLFCFDSFRPVPSFVVVMQSLPAEPYYLCVLMLSLADADLGGVTQGRGGAVRPYTVVPLHLQHRRQRAVQQASERDDACGWRLKISLLSYD